MMIDEQVRTARHALADMNYLGDPFRIEDGQAPHYFADFKGTTNIRLAPHQVRIEDARPTAELFTLDKQGIMLAHYPTLIRSFEDADQIGPQYIRECEQLIMRVTGAVTAFGKGPHCRFHGAADTRSRFDNTPARYVHADYSETSAAKYASEVPIDVSQYPRYAIYNIWRVVSPPPQSVPLAVCDARTVDPDDAIETTVVMNFPDREPITAQTMLYHPNDRHRWYYFSDMTPDEVMIFKGHDSDPARPIRNAHSAFVDPGSVSNSIRISVEARVLAVFDA